MKEADKENEKVNLNSSETPIKGNRSRGRNCVMRTQTNKNKHTDVHSICFAEAVPEEETTIAKVNGQVCLMYSHDTIPPHCPHQPAHLEQPGGG